MKQFLLLAILRFTGDLKLVANLFKGSIDPTCPVVIILHL
jgi:hypothetical protein